MPEYVLTGFIYKNFHSDPKQAAKFKEYYDGRKWVSGILNITNDVFTPETQTLLAEIAEKKSDERFKKDQVKHDLEKLKLKYSGEPSKEPLIVVQKNDGIDLKEGWHRTIQSLKLWPDGYKQSVWLEMPK